MNKSTITIVLLFASAWTYALSAELPKLAPEQAWKLLQDGNERAVNGTSTHPNSSVEHRNTLAGGQHPVAVVLSCSDSRVPPELVFDQGYGDLFVVRNAGNVVDEHVLGSIEYAVEHLAATLVVVMGHTECGAVKAALAGGHAEGNISSLVAAIHPAVVKTANEKENRTMATVDSNVKLSVEQLSNDPILKTRLDEKLLLIVGARYDLKTGTVKLLSK